MEDETETMTIVLDEKKKTSLKQHVSQEKKTNLDGYDEVPVKYMYHLHGSWIKCNKGNGFLKKVSQDTVIIHDIKEGIIEISVDEAPFHVKKTDLNYQHLIWLIKDHENQLNKEKIKFLEFRNKMNKMITEGKLKFIS
jgi:hypothetical protein